MTIVAGLELERISQTDLQTLYAKHVRFRSGRTGGKKFALLFRDASELNFAGMDLRDCEFIGSNLERAVLEDTNLHSANLFGVSLRSAKLSRAILSRADLRGAALSNAVLESCDLSYCDIRQGYILRRDPDGNYQAIRQDHSEVSGANFNDANMMGARLGRVLGQGTSMANTVLRNARMREADMTGSDLRGAVFTGADLTGANLSGCVLHGATLSGAILDEAVLERADLTAAHFTEAQLAKAKTEGSIVAKKLEHLDRNIQQIVTEHLRWIDTLGVEGAQADLSRTHLQQVDLATFNLSASNFDLATLSYSHMTGMKLTMASLRTVMSLETDFTDSDMRGVNLSDATLSGSRFANVKLGPISLLAGSVSKWASSLEGARLDQCSFRGADMTEVNLSGANLRGANLRGANLRRACLLDADLTGADLREANLDQTDQRGVVGLRL